MEVAMRLAVLESRKGRTEKDLGHAVNDAHDNTD